MKVLKKIAAFITAAMVAIGTCTVLAVAASIDETAVSMELDEEYICKYTENGELYDYKVQIKEKGILTVKVNTSITFCSVYLFDEDCANVPVASVNVSTGNIYSFGKADDPFAVFSTNYTSGKTVASTSWKVSKGTYYIRVTNTRDYKEGWRYEPYPGKIKVTTTFKASAEPELSCLSISVKKGSTLQLDGVFTIGSDTITWKSSKPSVATVSSKGKVTAKKKGTTTITATCGEVVLKIKIKVTG
ncbi:MAG: Ig-like domain-containing protein [Oscillospiraceae bacterium]